MDDWERKLMEKTKRELVGIIKEMQSERDAVKRDILRFQERMILLEDELRFKPGPY